MDKIPVEKNKSYIVDIIDNGASGEGVAKIDGFTVFIPKTIKGEKCEILVVKVLSSHAYGKLISVIEKSKDRVEEDCSTYKRCGGCDLRHMTYDATLKLKKNNVQNLVNKGLKNKIIVEDTIGMYNPFNYRNKAQYPVGLDKNESPEIGVFAERTHTIIPIEKCMIQTEESQKIAKTIRDFIRENNIDVYNEETKTGIFRHIVIKQGFKTNEVMCVLVINSKGFDKEQELVKLLTKEYPNIKTIIKNINMKNTNVILGTENINLYGNGYIQDKLGDYIFKISPMSFYQVNPIQAEILYNKAIEAADLKKDDVLCDLYCGIGTIGIFASSKVKKVYGIEIVKEAIEDAKENVKLNNIDNIEFILGDVEFAFDKLLKEEKVIPTSIIVDPPRRGLDDKTIQNIANIKPKKLVYISCNPATMVRDIAKIEDIYEIIKIQPVDMFPFTKHSEVISVLRLKQ